MPCNPKLGARPPRTVRRLAVGEAEYNYPYITLNHRGVRFACSASMGLHWFSEGGSLGMFLRQEAGEVIYRPLGRLRPYTFSQLLDFRVL